MDRAEALAEVHRLYDALEAAFAANAEARPDPGWDATELVPRASYIDAIASGHESPGKVLRGLREGLGDLAPRGSRHTSEQAQEAAFLRGFTARTGQSFWDIVPQPKRRLRVILASTEPPSEDDLRFVAGMVAEGAVPQRDIPKCAALLAGTAASQEDQ